MGDSHGRVGILFVVIMGLSAAAAVPFMNQKPPPTPDDVAVLPEEPEETAREAESARHVPRGKPKPRSIRTARWTGGETESTGASKPSPTPKRPMAVPAWGGGNPRPRTVTEVQGYRDADGRITFTARQYKQ